MKVGLVLEGGGMRGVYTAGVLDLFMDKGLYIDNIYGVSAGACHACSYISKQRGRAFRMNVDYLHDKRYCSLYSLITTGDLFGVEMSYNLLPNQLDLYDYETADRFNGEFYAVVTNCITGEAEYMRINDLRTDIIAIRASSSLPLLSRIVVIGGQGYLDGGAADSIPIAKSMADGNRKNIVILTQCPEFQRKPNELMFLIRAKYKKYPQFVEAMRTRHIHYNETLDLIRGEQADGRAFVIRPQKTPGVRRLEKDKRKLRILYEQGYEDADGCFEALMKFLGH
ncbi:MAG: patatin family protein [Syntrophomonadaceae bacterium]|nr:patatin family protein [Syntrophomonadaceae bacterium]